MAREKSTAQILRFKPDPGNARDELNLCEFPLALLSSRAPDGCNKLTFTDKVWDESRQKAVQRSLLVTAPTHYGLPTAKDEEVLLGLIHLTEQQHQFREPTVYFTRYELIKLLGWNQGAKSYNRIRESLARWKSVTLDYRHAWRRSDSWVSEIFSLIDNVTLCEGETQRTIDKDSNQINLPLSSFTWNRIFFESMQRKHFKKLDFGFYLQLETATAKRLFRFLDKRFGSGRMHWEFDLQEFAFEHIGLARTYNTGKIKEKLRPAIEELEQEGYLVPRTREERYVKRGKQWRVNFTRASGKAVDAQSQTRPLDADLMQRGVSRQLAEELAAAFDDEAVSRQIAVFDWIMENDRESLKNPAGYLVESIRGDFQPPAGYKTPAERAAAEKRLQQRKVVELKAQQTKDTEQQAVMAERAHIEAIREKLSVADLHKLEQAAMKAADPEQQQALSLPAFHTMQLRLLVDQQILQRYPMAECCP